MRERLHPASIESFRAVSRQYSDRSIMMHETIARKAGLSGADHKYLGILIQAGQMTAGDFAKLTGLTTGAITGIIDRLEKKKLVKRQFAVTDRRKVIIVPNVENTTRLLTPLFAELQKRTTALISSFTEDEIQIIEKYFRSATDIMTEVTKTLNAG